MSAVLIRDLRGFNICFGKAPDEFKKQGAVAIVSPLPNGGATVLAVLDPEGLLLLGQALDEELAKLPMALRTTTSL